MTKTVCILSMSCLIYLNHSVTIFNPFFVKDYSINSTFFPHYLKLKIRSKLDQLKENYRIFNNVCLKGLKILTHTVLTNGRGREYICSQVGYYAIVFVKTTF